MKNKIKAIKTAAVITATLLLAGSVASALTFNISSTTGDGSLGGYYTDGTTIGTDNNTTVGTGSSSSRYYIAIFAFRLPDLGGETFSSANFSLGIFHVENKNNIANADIYGLRFSDNNDVTEADFNNAGTNVLSDFLTSSSAGTVSSDESNNGGLSGWLGSNYVANRYAIFAIRLQGGAPGSSSTRYLIKDGASAPVLTINSVVPEPATYALIFGGLSLAFVMLRRRAKG